MGLYINQTQNGPLGSHQKAKSLQDAGAKLLGPSNPGYQPNLICVVNNGIFEAAGYCDSEREYQAFTHPSDDRLKTWLTWDRVTEFAK